MSQVPILIALDGPAASGKSSVARRVAAAKGLLYVNSGAMYRAFTWQVLRHQIDPGATELVVDLLERTRFECGEQEGHGTIIIDGDEPTQEELGAQEINGHVSTIAAIPEVRERLVAAQRAYGDGQSVVMEGRDIGTNVFPQADHKFYIDASVEVRQARRAAEGLVDQIAERDRKDSTRKTAPLTIAEDAIVIDSSRLTLDETVDAVLAYL